MKFNWERAHCSTAVTHKERYWSESKYGGHRLIQKACDRKVSRTLSGVLIQLKIFFFYWHHTENRIKEHIITPRSIIDLGISNDKYLYHLLAPTELGYLFTLKAYRTWVVYRRVVHYFPTPAKMTGAMTRHAHLILLCSLNMVKPHFFKGTCHNSFFFQTRLIIIFSRRSFKRLFWGV